MEWGIILAIIAMVAGAAMVVGGLLYEFHKKKTGKGGHSRVAKKLKSWCRPRRYKLHNDLTLQIEGKAPVEFDHIVVGAFGVLVVNTQQVFGDVYGQAEEKKWVYHNKNSRYELANPILENEEKLAFLREVFAKEGIYSVNIEQLTVFTPQKTVLYTAESMPVVKLFHLKNTLSKDRFERDNQYDITRLDAALMKHALNAAQVKNIKG